MPTDAELQAAIKAELNVGIDATFDGLLPTWWSLYTDRDQFIAFLYTKKRAIAYLMGQTRKLVDVQIGYDQIKAQQRFGNLEKMMKGLVEEIKEEDRSGSVPYMVSVASVNESPDSFTEALELANYYYGYYR